jgi:predicted oxidoreductase
VSATPVDAIVVGAGLSGLVAATEIAAAGKHVTIIDQEPDAKTSADRLTGRLEDSFSSIHPNSEELGLRDSIELRATTG